RRARARPARAGLTRRSTAPPAAPVDGAARRRRRTTVEVEFDAELWVWDSRKLDTWTFVSLPEDIADDVLDHAGHVTRGFGSLRVEVAVGATTWRTSIFPSSSAKTFVLPVK